MGPGTRVAMSACSRRGMVGLAWGCSEAVAKTPPDSQPNSPCAATESQKSALHQLLPLAFPSSLCLPADFLMRVRIQANLDAVLQPLLWFGLTAGIVLCRDVFLLPAANRLHRTSTPISSRYQDLSQATKLTATSCPLVSWLHQLIHTSASHVLHVWEAIAETRTLACWSELQNVAGNTVPLLHKMF